MPDSPELVPGTPENRERLNRLEGYLQEDGEKEARWSRERAREEPPAYQPPPPPPEPSLREKWDANVVKYEGETTFFGLGKVGHGEGKVWYRDGSIYEGQLKRGLRHGSGTLYFESESGRLRHVGIFKKNESHGTGVLYWPNGKRKFEGSYRNNRPHGQGTVYDKEGTTRFIGEFRSGLANGKGAEYVLQAGMRPGPKHVRIAFEGKYHSGKRHGKGAEYDEGGSVRRQGRWKHGEYKRGWFT